jgi:hypothetical protein
LGRKFSSKIQFWKEKKFGRREKHRAVLCPPLAGEGGGSFLFYNNKIPIGINKTAKRFKIFINALSCSNDS